MTKRFATIVACISLLSLRAAPKIVFQADFEDTLEAVGSGETVRPITVKNAKFSTGMKSRALVADTTQIIYPPTVVPGDAGTIEILVSPLKNGCGNGWMAFCGDAKTWGVTGMPKLWRWNGNPRFDMDAGGKAITASSFPDFDWSVGKWHLFTGTWDRESGKISFYLDGKAVDCKDVAPWENDPSAGFMIGSAIHINNTGVNWAHALIDSVTIWDASFSPLAIRQRARTMGFAQRQDNNVPAHPDWKNSLAPKGTPASELLLAENGKALYSILIPQEASTIEQKAAIDLSDWLSAMTQTNFPVVREGKAVETPVVSIGKTRRFAEAALPAGKNDLGTGGYGIAVKKGDLYLWGGSRRGVVNAVYALLEEDLGCRWYHRDSSCIPQHSTLTFQPVPRTFVPVLEIRDPFYWDAFQADWSLRNRSNSPNARVPEEFGGRIHYASGFFVHTYNSLVPPKKHFAEHPEYYSEINGKRSARQLCLTNPEVLQLSIEKVRQVLRASPSAQLISVSPNDGRGYCECAKCRALDLGEGSKSATLLTFVNAVADAIRDEFPAVKISTLAYLDTVQPPKTIVPRDNVVIRLCTDRHIWSRPFEFITETNQFCDAAKAWADIGAKIHIWDYTVNFSHYSLPMPNMPIVIPNVRWMIDHNACGIMLQGAYQGPGSARGPLRCWVWAKQLWDPTLNTRDLIRDFNYGFYGEAAEPLQAYSELLWRIWEKEHMVKLRASEINIRYSPGSAFLTAEFATEATRLFAQAEALAKDPAIKRRVKLAKFALLYLKLSREPGFVVGDDYAALCDEFESIAKQENIRHLWEGGFKGKNHVEQKLAFWRGLVTAQNAELAYLRIGPDSMFRPDPEQIGEKNKWFAPAFADLGWARIVCGADGGWNKQGFPKLTGDGWYRIRFTAPTNFGKGKKIRLYIGAADEDCTVYLNGKLALEHTCASTKLPPEEIWNKPILFDPGTHLKQGGENVLAIKVHNRLGMGGIWKPIYLLAYAEDPDPNLILDIIRFKEKK